VVGGAYSVDKEYRQLKGWQWFESEQLTTHEQNEVFEHTEGKRYDMILTHTCPFSWMPIDLFLPFIDQSKVDNTMELLFDKMTESIEFKVWCYGHYHADRWQNPQARMFFKDVVDLQMIMGYCD
jgi:3-oxoacid CoA-transferase subunit A